jgi:hypothetical protein
MTNSLIYDVKVVLGVTVSIVPNPKTGQRLTKEYLTHLNEAVNAEANPITYLGIDPGKANGVCGYDAKYYLQFMLTVPADDMNMFVHQFNRVEKCIMEGYKLYPNKLKEQVYSDLETPRVIGRVESWAEMHQVELIIQPASIKPTGYKWLGVKPLPKSNPRNHELDGHIHFMYWAIKRGHITAESLFKRGVPE